MNKDRHGAESYGSYKDRHGAESYGSYKDRHGAESYGSYINIYLCNMCSIMWISLSVICGWSMFFLNFLVLQLLRI